MNVKLWSLNLILTGLMLFFSWQTYHSWNALEKALPFGIQEKSAKTVEITPPPKLADYALSAESTYEDVVRKNLFSPARKEKLIEKTDDESAENKPVEIENNKISGTKIVLDGIILTDNKKMALIRTPPKNRDDKPYVWLVEGQSIGNLKVDSIETDRIILTEKGKKYAILLYDQGKAKEEQPRSPAASDTPAEEDNEPTVIGAEKKTVNNTPQPSPPESSQSDDGYEIVKTPFGEIRRKKR